MIQFSAGGKLVSGLAGIGYEQAAIAIGFLVTLYLSVGGFRTVIATDMLQGIARFLLIPILVGALYYASSGSGTSASASVASIESMPTEVVVGLVLTGFFSAVASADVWQRIYAAGSDRDSMGGLVFGAVLMLLFGALLVYVGLSAKALAPTSVADDAFATALSSGIPKWVVTTAIVLVLVSVLSTADTEIFVLTSLIGREASREGSFRLTALDGRSPPTWARTLVVIMGALSTSAALFFSDVIEIYVWLICLLLAISPAVVAGILGRFNGTGVAISILLNLSLFGALAAVGKITADTAYYIVVPGFVLIFIIETAIKLQRPRQA
jgi:Na+/proline symporter